MNPAEALQERVRAFIDGRITLQVLCTWLGEHVDELEASGDPEALDLAGEIWGLSSELGYGHRTMEEMRAELAACLPFRAITITGALAVTSMASVETVALAISSRLRATSAPFRREETPFTFAVA
jgi:hypothetical protein